MNNLAAVLHAPWYASIAHEAKIDGTWAEDGTQYQITAPPQLIHKIVEMQNHMYKQYMDILAREAEIARLESALTRAKSYIGWTELGDMK